MRRGSALQACYADAAAISIRWDAASASGPFLPFEAVKRPGSAKRSDPALERRVWFSGGAEKHINKGMIFPDVMNHVETVLPEIRHHFTKGWKPNVRFVVVEVQGSLTMG